MRNILANITLATTLIGMFTIFLVNIPILLFWIYTYLITIGETMILELMIALLISAILLSLFVTIIARLSSTTPSSRTTAPRNGHRRDWNRTKDHARSR